MQSEYDIATGNADLSSLLAGFAVVPKNLGSENEVVLLRINQTIVANALIFIGKTNDYLSYCEVRKDQRGNAYKIPLLHAIFERARQRTGQLVISRFTPDGRKYLLPALEIVSKDYPDVAIYHEPGV